jgi:hypothetical protein
MVSYDELCDGYDGYDDYLEYIAYDAIDNTEEDYDPEEDVSEWERV